MNGRDGAVDEVWVERLGLIGCVRPILASADMTFAGGVRGVGCLVEGPIKVDVVFLAEREVSSPPPCLEDEMIAFYTREWPKHSPLSPDRNTERYLEL